MVLSQWTKRKNQVDSELVGFWLLCGVWVLGATVDFELLGDHATELGLGQHAFDSSGDDVFRTLFEEFLSGDALEATGIARVVVVEFLLELVPGEDHLVSVDADDKVTAIDVRCEGGLVLAAKQGCNLSGGSTDGLTFEIDNKPLALNFLRLGAVCFHHTLRMNGVFFENNATSSEAERHN